MTREKQIKQERQSALLDVEVSDVFVVQNSKRRAYIEQFKHKGLNFTQRKLGTFLGFFIVRDSSASSANIVNFLTAEIKKEYFAFPKRGMAESFETALHRVNQALAEVVNVGNVDWLGTIDSAVCAIDESAMYFSVTGDAVVLLLRGENIMNISEGIASEEAKQHPLKTFVDISSGQLMNGDKIILTSPELLDLISLDELQRNALRLGRDNFIQFVNTVLTNECKMAAASIIDVNEKTISVDIDREIKQEMGEESLEEMSIPDNVFSAQVFENETENEVKATATDAEEVDEMNEGESDGSGEEYIDKRTGHIYLQGDENVDNSNQLWSSIVDFFKDMIRGIKEGTKKKFRRGKKKIEKLIDSRNVENKIVQVDSVKPANVNYEISKLKAEIGVQDKKNRRSKKNKSTEVKKIIVQDKSEEKKSNDQGNKNSMDLVRKYYKDSSEEESFAEKDNIPIVDKILDFLELAIDSFNAIIVKIYKGILSGFTKVFSQKSNNVRGDKALKNSHYRSKSVDSLAGVKNFWQSVGGKNKIIGLAILALCLAVPLFFINKGGNESVDMADGSVSTDISARGQDENGLATSELQDNSGGNVPTVVNVESEIEGNINDSKEVYKGTALVYIDQMNKYNVAVTKDSVVVLDDENIKYSFPDNSGAISYATVMDDLNLVFLLTDENKLFSFSPISKEFKSQSLNIDNKNIKAINAYMKYLYVVAEDGITKHVRKGEGFDDGKNWLKEEFETNKVDDISINESIYLVTGGEIKVLFSGRQKGFSLVDNKIINLIYAKDTQNLWAINNEKATLYKFNRFSGRLLDEFIHNDFKETGSFFVDEKDNVAIITTDKGVFEFKLKKK